MIRIITVGFKTFPTFILLSIFNFWFSILLQYYINDQNYNCCAFKTFPTFILLSIFNFWFSIVLQYYINDQNYNCCVLKHSDIYFVVHL